jgi:hypothetical protein
MLEVERTHQNLVSHRKLAFFTELMFIILFLVVKGIHLCIYMVSYKSVSFSLEF